MKRDGRFGKMCAEIPTKFAFYYTVSLTQQHTRGFSNALLGNTEKSFLTVFFLFFEKKVDLFIVLAWLNFLWFPKTVIVRRELSLQQKWCVIRSIKCELAITFEYTSVDACWKTEISAESE